MSDRLAVWDSGEENTVAGLYLWLWSNRIPPWATIVTDMEGSDNIYFEWNEND